MQRGRITAAALVLVVGGLIWWWVPQADKPDPTAPGEPTGKPASVASEPQLEGLGLGAPGGMERIESRLRVEARREGPAPDAGPDLIAVKCRVVDESGEPVAKARVRVRRRQRIQGALVISADQELVTHFDGTFRCAIPEGQDREVTVLEREAHSGSLPKMLASDAEETTFVVQRAPNLAGVVLDAAGAPMEGASVQLRRTRRPRPSSVLDRSLPRRSGFDLETDEEGAFEARLLPSDDRFDLMVRPSEEHKDEYLMEGRKAVAIGTTGLVIRFPEPVYIEGRVEDAMGNLIEDCGVYAARGDESRVRRVGRLSMLRGVHPDRRTGRFKAGPLRPGAYELGVTVRGARSFEGPRVEAPASNVVVTCPVYGLRGIILPGGQQDMHRYRVRCVPMQGLREGRAMVVPVGPDGTFWIGLPRNGRYRLYVLAWDGSDRYGELTDARPGADAHELVLREGQSISGQLLEAENASLYGVAALRNGIEVAGKLDADGGFEIRGLAPGDWSILLYRNGMGPVERARVRATVAAGSTGVKLTP